MNRGFIQRLIWAYVAAWAAWEQYPMPTTVVRNDDLHEIILVSEKERTDAK